jgi:hypothetical protein
VISVSSLALPQSSHRPCRPHRRSPPLTLHRSPAPPCLVLPPCCQLRRLLQVLHHPRWLVERARGLLRLHRHRQGLPDRTPCRPTLLLQVRRLPGGFCTVGSDRCGASPTPRSLLVLRPQWSGRSPCLVSLHLRVLHQPWSGCRERGERTAALSVVPPVRTPFVQLGAPTPAAPRP